MKIHNILCLCMLLATAWTTVRAQMVDPRGARPVLQASKADKCATEKNWDVCTDDDWGSKCPSGCRVQGLLDKTDHDLLTKIDKIRRLLDDYNQKYRNADQSSKQTYDYLRDRLTASSGDDNKYMTLAESLRRRIVDIKIKIERQLNILEALKDRVKDQVIEIQRLEVDIDIKLRACKGSCSEYAEFSVDRDSYVALDKQMDQLESMRQNSVETVGALRVMKSRQLKEVTVPSIYKSGAPQDERQYFGDVGQSQLTLQTEGATADAPATVGKFPECKALKNDHSPRSPEYHYAAVRDRYGRCRRKSLHPLCSDDEWTEKCPNGCGLAGLIDATETDIQTRLAQICSRAEEYHTAATSAMLTNVAVYNSHRRIIVKNYVAELRYAERFEDLQRNLTLLQRRSTQLNRKLHNLHGLVQRQILDMRRLEVDIDIKIRSCHGSCKHTFVHRIDHEAYTNMESELAKFNLVTAKKATLPAEIRKLNLLPVIRPPISLEYRSIEIVRKEFLTQFEDIDLNQVFLEDLLNELDLE